MQSMFSLRNSSSSGTDTDDAVSAVKVARSSPSPTNAKEIITLTVDEEDTTREIAQELTVIM